ncbi:MAG: DUF99 family protein [Archaeoglobaceae archaeon]
MKKWRVVGIDDSFSKDFCCLVGCVMSGRNVEGFIYEEISVDGLDSTKKILKMITKSKFSEQIRVIFLNGITFGGFNVVDITEIYSKTGIPVIVVMNRRPNLDEFYSALRNFKDFEKRIEIVKRAGEIFQINDIYAQICGLSVEDAKHMVELNKFEGKIPEALRLAHLVASAIVHGESKK